MQDENNNIPDNDFDSDGAGDDLDRAEVVLEKATETVLGASEMLVSFLPAAMTAGNSLSTAMNRAGQVIKRQNAWMIVLFLMTAFTTGNLIVGAILVRNLSQVCGR